MKLTEKQKMALYTILLDSTRRPEDMGFTCAERINLASEIINQQPDELDIQFLNGKEINDKEMERFFQNLPNQEEKEE